MPVTTWARKHHTHELLDVRRPDSYTGLSFKQGLAWLRWWMWGGFPCHDPPTYARSCCVDIIVLRLPVESVEVSRPWSDPAPIKIDGATVTLAKYERHREYEEWRAEKKEREEEECPYCADRWWTCWKHVDP